MRNVGQKNAHFLSQNHARRKPDFKLGEILGAKDHIVEWKKPARKPDWITQDEYDSLPSAIRVREFSVNGVVYVTTLFTPNKYPRKELAKFYGNRWKIELDFRSIKTHMGMEMLR